MGEKRNVAEQGSGQSHNLGFFPPFFSPKKVHALVALSLLRGPVGMDALGCGRWVPKHPGKRCSCIDSSGGARAGCLMRAAVASSLLMLQPRDG